MRIQDTSTAQRLFGMRIQDIRTAKRAMGHEDSRT